MPRVLPIALLLSSLAVARPAAALDEGQWQLAAGGQVAVFNGEVAPLNGGVRIDGRHALTDTLSLGAALASTWFDNSPFNTRIVTASTGITVAWNVLRWVPFAELHAAVAAGDEWEMDTAVRLGGELSAGVEYLIDRRWSLAAASRLLYLPLDLTTEQHGGGALLSLGVRLARTF